ncbi:2-succinyl-5-enolpyruvyl-6-hydroxy-3-cyclohexene-1-carboxylic-acid synthase [Pseudogracilibacillus auburnensis]|uniref:2-succinyl-5-enolpyruvyl-6-hydroxy-3- cyclohexene-1-carboxylic-acid synthase n=1 Tax=Pseudogracilibacillus auburnensis TaxID=1494959 RepID=UPI001A979899|nr:2-succinyl-5-enolpyruvyl-6-hydroxy-3-cyclohexene-1-carboxylic-acid synthase [Pseudogracilibacillus auburnensis]MBO1005976.1 2-succinyl-5-enolpyruvyl-6-hydroxy-3-cyclohexene-1-carboxylic-acid synthase [Pseudogracilibacillus auburnensis]
MNHQEILAVYLSSFISGLVQSGVKDIVISPGSRSTPLALIAAEHRNMEVYVNVDERSAAFFALGLAKASKKPVALLCTSGTAAANYYPAIIEANLTGVPLIVLTADRPHELRDVGAPQAIDQLHLYGDHVKWFAEMALPESGARQLKYTKTTAIRAVKEAMVKPKGPVHLNFPLREPLIPSMDLLQNKVTDSGLAIESGQLVLPPSKVRELLEEWSPVERGLIICGPIDEPDFPNAVQMLAIKLGFPILADPLSQVRSNVAGEHSIIDSYDAILKSEEARDALQPELIIRFGGIPVSKSLSIFLNGIQNAEHVVVDGSSGWRDPNNVATKMIFSDETELCKEMAGMISDKKKKSSWMNTWKSLDEITKQTIATSIIPQNELDEGKVIYELAKLLPVESTVFVGNSMPIRDMDTFFHVTEKNIRIMANRGANGIDGVVSTALGASIYERPLFLVIGDLSFFHDLNGLLAAKMHKLNINIIVINNDGGGIFSFLPQANEPTYFDLLFGTPTGLNFEHAVKMYHGQYTKVLAWEDFHVAMMEAVSHEGLNVIEVPTDRAKNLTSHRQIWEHVSREINKFLQGVEI